MRETDRQTDRQRQRQRQRQTERQRRRDRQTDRDSQTDRRTKSQTAPAKKSKIQLEKKANKIHGDILKGSREMDLRMFRSF